jgi:DNA/RNA-binding domain of Phe-tRNA-synthetase-like protein
MKFSIDDGLFELFPGLRIGCLICRIDNSRYGEHLLEGVIQRIQTGFGYERPQDHPRIRAWREAFAALRVSPSKYQSSIESLVRKAFAQRAKKVRRVHLLKGAPRRLIPFKACAAANGAAGFQTPEKMENS